MCSFVMAQKKNSFELDTLHIYQLENIEVKATRVNKKIPIAHFNLSQEEIQRNNYGKDIPSLLQLTPSIVSTSDAGNGIGYSDIRLRGTDGTRINVTTNGVPMNDPESHKLYWVDSPDLISSIGTMQIQRGTGSSTNGAGAFGGSINMTTSALPTLPSGEASFSYGSYTTSKEAVKLSSGLINNHWAFDGRFSHIYSHGYMNRAFSNLNSYMFQGAYYEDKTIWKFITFGGHERTYNAWDGLTKKQMEQKRTYNPCREITDDNKNVIGFYNNQTDNYTQINNQLSMNHTFNEYWNLNLTFHYTRGYGYYNQWKNQRTLSEYSLTTLKDSNGKILTKSNLTRKKNMENDFGGFVGSANYHTNNLDMAFGTAANIYSGDHWGNVTSVEKATNLKNAVEYYRNYSRKTDFNIFTKATWTIFQGMNLFGDLQYRHIHHQIYGTGSSYQYVYDENWNDIGYMQKLNIDKDYNFFNPKAGFSYIIGNHNIYASFAIAQKEPTRDDFTNATTNMNPKPEKMYDWEAGYTFGNSWLNAGINFYYMQYHNQLIQTGAINPDTYDVLYFNIPDSYRRGIELTANIKILSCLTLSGNATFSQNKIKNYTESIYSYDTSSNVDRFLGTKNISYSPSTICGAIVQFNKGGFNANIHMQHVGKQFFNNSQKEELSLNPYSYTDMNASYTFQTKRLKEIRLGISINNLFNKKYCSNAYIYDSGTSKADGDWYDTRYFPQATRNFLTNVTISF